MSDELTPELPGEVEPDVLPEATPIVPAASSASTRSTLFHTPSHSYPALDDDIEVIDLADAGGIDNYTPEERSHWAQRYSETMREFRAGELVKGRIVAITDTDVAVDIGFKSEGAIPKAEFTNLDQCKVGDDLEVFIDSIEDTEGTLVLSKSKAEFMRTWEKIRNLYETGEMIEAKISRRIKGGMVVDLFGMEAFLPGSQIDVHPVRDFDALVGASMDFRIIKVNEIRKNVVLSHKVLKEEALREIRAKVLSELQEGQVVEGVVKNITDFGVFVDLGGVDGLLHITDLSWGRVSHPSDVVTLDDRIKVKVLHYDRDKQRISLGLKQLKEHHWEELEAKYPINARVRGKVVSIVKYGAFVELEPGVEGLVHISEMSWTQHVKHPSQMVTLGDEAEVVILNIDRENRKISLGMKQVEEDPWERLQATYVPGTRHTGAVRDLVPFGAFVELEPGIDGLIHISDLSWTRKVRHPGEIVKKGQELEVVVLSFDRNERRIALGLKQIEEDPWDRFERDYTVHTRTDGTVLRVLDKGVVVMLPLGVEGFIPNSQLGRSIMSESKSVLREGDNLELEVLEFDRGNHRIVLTHSQVEKAKERAAYRSYQEGQEDEGRTTIGDILMAGQHPLVEGVGDEAAPAEEAIPAKKPRKKREKKVVEEGSGTEAMEESFTSDETIALDKTVATEETVDGQSLSQPEAEPPAVEEPPTEPV